MPQGIDLEMFNADGKSFIVTPADGVPASRSASAAPPVAGVEPSRTARGAVLTHGFGLKCGVLQGDPRAFLSKLEAQGQTRRTSASQINVLNHRSAQIMLNDRFGPEVSDAQVSAGTILKVCPNVLPRGLVHLDVQREVEHDASTSGSRAAALMHQVVLRDGQTVIVGGFYAEHRAAPLERAPGTGPVRVTGPVTRRQSGVIERTETIVILTPHVVNAKSVEAGQTRHRDVPRAIGRDRPNVQQAVGTQSIKGQRPRQIVSPTVAVQSAPEQPAVPASFVPRAGLEPPRRLPTESIISVRSISDEVPGSDPAGDVEAIPVLDLPGDDVPAPTIRPARGKREP
jgi:type II secretory pathway component GspD/PulD (secretin)